MQAIKTHEETIDLRRSCMFCNGTDDLHVIGYRYVCRECMRKWKTILEGI